MLTVPSRAKNQPGSPLTTPRRKHSSTCLSPCFTLRSRTSLATPGIILGSQPNRLLSSADF